MKNTKETNKKIAVEIPNEKKNKTKREIREEKEKLAHQAYSDKITNEIIQKLGFDKLPQDVVISTMTLVCSVNTNFICRNIARCVDLSYGGILSVKCGNDDDIKTNRSLLPKKQKTGKKKKKKSVFYNQVSIYVMVKGKNKKPVSVKLFLNGAIQITGCKTIGHAIEALNKIFIELHKTKGLVVMKNFALRVIDLPFMTNTNITLKNVKDIKVVMINSNFTIGFKVDRLKLHNLMLSEGYDVSFDPEKHACVNIKFDHTEKQLSIFVFEGGSIIITGVKNCHQILEAYDFINKYLLMNYNKIVKNDNLTNVNIIKFLDKTNIKEQENDEFLLSDSDDTDSEYSNILLNSDEMDLTEAEKYISEIYNFDEGGEDIELDSDINSDINSDIDSEIGSDINDDSEDELPKKINIKGKK